ncbi:MAG TPA: S8 family serine peptidase [Bacteriovoracaceae bacterium]|nr:S8 family serine peptidase [Bacteriovoracaceae bacterium]
MKWISSLMVLGSILTVEASTVAVIDSGLDYKHEMIVSNLWVNPLEVEDRRDNDNNGYQDDINGWNFAEQNGVIIDYKYIGTFSPDCKKYFDIQGKNFLGKATPEEIAWMKEKIADKKFIAEMGKFGNFVHGTHVAGITVNGSKNEAMGIKLIPTEFKPFFEGLSLNKSNNTVDRWILLETTFVALATEQMKLLGEIALFINSHKAEVANGSFGTGFKQAKIITDNAFKLIFFRKPTEEESNKAAGLFINALVKAGNNFASQAPDTLFVFAAGNDGLSNDEFGTSPANIKADNVISVGATYKNEFFAKFSNFGVKMVDIAAPGMLIKSSIPGNEYLEVSGTSQAAPFVAKVAGKIKDANDKLTPAEVKKILMGTVDKKAFLADKVATGGIVNSERAVFAAQISKSMPLALAITTAKLKVKDEPTHKSVVRSMDVIPMPLAPMFQ